LNEIKMKQKPFSFFYAIFLSFLGMFIIIIFGGFFFATKWLISL
jgi:hypothetical protein